MSLSKTASLEEYQQEYARLLSLVAKQETTIEALRHRLHLFTQARFGRKTEKGVVPEQGAFEFDETYTVDAQPDVSTGDTTETITYTRNKKGTGRKALPKSLPYIEKIHDLTDAEKQCSCGCALTHISDTVTEQLDTLPQMTFRVVHIRKKYACKTCEETIRTAPMPKQPIPQSIAAPGLLAAIINSKFNHHMPLYRQETIFSDAGVPVTRATLSQWMIKSAHLLSPLVKLMEANIQEHDVAYSDETTLQVLNEKDRLPTQKSYMWLFIGGPPDKRAFVYQYHPTRSHGIATDFFADFKGYLHADCYKAYIELGLLGRIKHVACFAHARRYFVDVVKQGSKKQGLANQIIALVAKLYFLEKALKEKKARPEIVFAERQTIALPILHDIKTLLDTNQTKVPPKSPLGKALFYSLNHWQALNMYLSDGRLEIDNNLSERSIKPFVIGRKNWLFHGSESGASAGSILFSLIETCKAHKIDTFAWFKYALMHVTQANTLVELEALLPYNINPQLLDSMRNIPELIMPVKGAVI